MSDVPPPLPSFPQQPPPPPLGSGSPPPPPPNLMAPPGYAAYTATPMGSVALKRVRPVSRVVIILVIVSAAFSVIELVARAASRDEAEAYQAGELSNTEFVEGVAAYALTGFAASIVAIAGAVLTIIWMYRITGNLRRLHRGTTWGPGWAIGGWFAPPFLWVIPTLMFREMWQASDPDVPVGGDWRSRPNTSLPFLWFVLYGVIPLVLMIIEIGDAFGSLSNSNDQLANQITGNAGPAYIGAASAVASAAVFIVFVRGLTDRHSRLTGEAHSPAG